MKCKLLTRVADPHSFHPDPDPDPAPAFLAEYSLVSSEDIATFDFNAIFSSVSLL